MFEPWERRGIASAMLARARLDAPRYRWWTSGQMSHARGFWVKIAERCGLGYRIGDGCEHIESRVY